MRILFLILSKIFSKWNRIKAHIRGYYYSKLFKSCGKKRPFINRYVVFSFPGNVECGNRVIINPQCYFASKGGIIIEDDVVFSAGCRILSSSLKVENCVIQKRHVHKGVKICRNAWIGAGATVCPGVTVGKIPLLPQGAVVTKDMPPDSVVAGVPAKVIRSLCKEKEGI